MSSPRKYKPERYQKYQKALELGENLDTQNTYRDLDEKPRISDIFRNYED